MTRPDTLGRPAMTADVSLPTKVLIVDDEPDILLMLRVNLEGEGFETVLAADGMTALERIERERPDLVLLDVMMPVLDGWGVLDGLAALSHRPAVVVVSAKATPVDVTRAFALGASEYVTKPFGIDALVGVIREVLERSSEDQDRRRNEVLSDPGADG